MSQQQEYSSLKLVDVAQFRSRLESAKVSSASVRELYEFGKFMVEDVQQRAAYIDSKLGNYLTWASALLGVVLLDQTFARGNLAFAVLSVVAGGTAMGALVSCFWGLRSKLRPSPSEVDWLGLGETLPDETLRRHYVSMLHMTHSAQQTLNFDKARWTWRAEKLLATSATAVGLIAISRGLSGFWHMLFA